ncbi:MAG: T9SS type A sorting domain-containing protein, partial [Vicingaceae bacterium]
YYLVYEMVQNDVVLTYPIGREGFKPGTVETIRWDAYQSASTFNLEYTIDNGVTWNTIDAAVDSNLRYYNWVVPNHLTGQALVRISNNVSSSTSQAAFSIIATPLNLNIDYVCPDSMQMSWSSVAGATAYEVSMLGNKYMDSVGVTNTNSYVFYGINPMQTNWFSVRALGPLNARGERAVAVEQVPGINNCVVATDAAILSLYPAENAQFLDCITSNIYPSLDIKNEGQTVLSNIPVFYQLNGGSIISETYAGNINPGATINFTFSTPLNSVAGTNNLLVWSDANNDGNYYNDSANTQFNFIGSTLQTLPWSENFESFALCGTANNCGLEVCAMSNSFLNEHNGSVDDIDWRTDQGGTVSNSTGPNVDFNPGTTTGKYLFLEASGGCDFQTAELISPCIDLTNISAAQLSFAYNMYGLDMGALFVDVFANGTWNNALVAINGNQGPNWLIETLSLSAYTGGIINLRFRGVTGNGYQSDLAIDDINVSGTVGVDDITNNLAFNIYPNPSNGIFNFSYLGETNFSLTVIDVNGKVVYAKEILKNTSGQKGIIDISDYSDGIYMLILTSDNERFTQKIIKN